MSLAEVILVIIWLGVSAYGVFGGADFGAGIWDLLAGGPQKGLRVRALLERSIGPVWEANHVWLIFVLVYLWTAFPEPFAAIASTMLVPLSLVALGIIFRGSAFAFRKWAGSVRRQRLFGATFAGSSVLTPFFLGTVAGGVASGRVPLGNAAGDPVTAWLNPTSLMGGTLAVVTCAYLAAVLVSRDAAEGDDQDLAEHFRRRALVSGLVAGFIALIGVFVLKFDAPNLFDRLLSAPRYSDPGDFCGQRAHLDVVVGQASLGHRSRNCGARHRGRPVGLGGRTMAVVAGPGSLGRCVRGVRSCLVGPDRRFRGGCTAGGPGIDLVVHAHRTRTPG